MVIINMIELSGYFLQLIIFLQGTEKRPFGLDRFIGKNRLSKKLYFEVKKEKKEKKHE